MMEQKVLSSTESTIPTSPKPKNWVLIGVVVLLLVFGGSTIFLAYQNFQLRQKPFNEGRTITSSQIVTVIPTQLLTPTGAVEGGGLLTVNAYTSIDDKRRPYFIFQVKYPSKYFVTSDDMVTSYETQGGMAPPRLIFTKRNQPLGEVSLQTLWNKEEDCILIWSTSGWSTIEDFQTKGSARAKTPQTVTKEEVPKNNFRFDKRVVRYEGRSSNNIEAFVQLPETVSYYFQTCNMNSEKDLDVILQNFKVRAYSGVD